MIKDKDISIVIQGPILGEEEVHFEKKITQRVCLNIRKNLPNAEIIISTWEGSNIDNLIYDKIIFNKDPGPILMTLNGKIRNNNTNRMITSTINGLKQASRKYVIKMRSDLYFENLNFLKYFKKYSKRENKGILNSRILTLSANNYRRSSDIIFTLNDWFMFGEKEDIIKVWDIPLQEEKKLYKEENKLPEFEKNLVGEDYVWSSFLKKDDFFKKILNKYKFKIPITEENVNFYEKSLAEYVIIYNGKDLGINSYKYFNKNYVRRDFAKASCYTHMEWLKLQKKYINPDIKIPLRIRDLLDIFLYWLIFKVLQKKFNKFYLIFKNYYNRNKNER